MDTKEVSVYKQVIDIIRAKPNLEALFFKIAQEYPEAIIHAYAILKPTSKEVLEAKTMRIYKDELGGGKIKAIKYLRGELEIGLKEAKEYVERLLILDDIRVADIMSEGGEDEEFVEGVMGEDGVMIYDE